MKREHVQQQPWGRVAGEARDHHERSGYAEVWGQLRFWRVRERERRTRYRRQRTHNRVRPGWVQKYGCDLERGRANDDQMPRLLSADDSC